jgi:hypothetical protein
VPRIGHGQESSHGLRSDRAELTALLDAQSRRENEIVGACATLSVL